MNEESKFVRINVDKLSKVVESNPLPQVQISKFVLGHNESYLNKCFKSGSMRREAFDTLCEFLQIDGRFYLASDKPTEEKKPKVEKETDMETLIVGLNQMYNVQRSLYAEIKEQNQLIRDLTQVIRNQATVLGNVNKNLNENTEKVKAIFTEVKYKRM